MLKLPAIITGGLIAGEVHRDRLVIEFYQVNTNKAGKKIKTPVMRDEGIGTQFQGIDAAIHKYNVLISPQAGRRQGEARDIRLVSGGSLFDAVGGIEGYTLENCGATAPVHKMGLFYLGGRGGKEPANRDIVFKKCFAAGAVDEHILRAHNCVNCRAEDCNFPNDLTAPWASKRGASFNIRDGENWKLLRNLGGGQVIFGPLADKDGGINEKDPIERDRLLSRRLINTLVEDFQLENGYVMVEAGVEGLILRNMTGQTPPKHGQACWISFKRAYGPRDIPKDVTLENCRISIRKGEKLFSGKAKNLKVINCFWRYVGEPESAFRAIDKSTIQAATQ